MMRPVLAECQKSLDLFPECPSRMQVLDDHLKNHEWLAADQYTIADIANFSWVRSSSVATRAPSAISGRPQPMHCPSVQLLAGLSQPCSQRYPGILI